MSVAGLHRSPFDPPEASFAADRCLDPWLVPPGRLRPGTSGETRGQDQSASRQRYMPWPELGPRKGIGNHFFGRKGLSLTPRHPQPTLGSPATFPRARASVLPSVLMPVAEYPSPSGNRIACRITTTRVSYVEPHGFTAGLPAKAGERFTARSGKETGKGCEERTRAA